MQYLSGFRCFPSSDAVLRSRSRLRIIGGGMRAGKTTLAAAIVAGAAMKIPILDSKGNAVDCGAPTNRPLTIGVVGLGCEEVGHMYRAMFENPLLPDMNITSVADEVEWEYKEKGWFKRITLRNGTEIISGMARSGGLPAGEFYDLVWLDYLGDNLSMLSEARMRTIDVGGFVVWSTPYRKELFQILQQGHAEYYALPTLENHTIDSAVVGDMLREHVDAKGLAKFWGIGKALEE